MAIVLPAGRPAIDIVKGSYEQPEPPWSHLGDPEPRRRLEAAIAAVGRVDYVGHPHMSFGGTAFVVGRDLLVAEVGPIIGNDDGRYRFEPGQSAVIDFGHEREAEASLRAAVEEVIAVDPVWRVALVRATLPPEIRPLSLVTADPGTLVDAEVVLLGYPSWDQRNDAALMQRLFRGAMDVKRMLPGRVRGLELWPPRRSGEEAPAARPALAHDCTSTGGCGSAPLVDIRTGDVVGIHFAGQFLKMNFAVPAAGLAENPAFVGAGVRFSQSADAKSLRSVRGEALRVSSLPVQEAYERAPVRAAPVTEPPAASSPPAARGGEPPSSLEIILSAARPALLVANWRSEASEAAREIWPPLLMPHERRLDVVARAVGKLVTDRARERWNGTAFLVGDRLALTASFVIQDVVDGAGMRATIRPGARPGIDFSEALGLPAGAAVASIVSLRFIHPFFQLALLELERVPEGAAALDVAAQMPSDLSGRAVAVFSFAAAPGVDEELAESEAAIYRERWGRLFLQPGRAMQVGEIPGLPGVPGLRHDCMTRIGSAGAPLLDIGTGYVVGVHTHARWLEGGYAQPTWELARDPHVWPFAINFRPDPRPPWLDRWDADPSSTRHNAPVPVQQPRDQRWTVDDVPIDWTRKEPKELERLLVASIEPEMALYSAENVGLRLGTVTAVGSTVLLWREIIKKASTAGVLRPLLEELASEPGNAGIAPKLRMFL